MNRLCLALALNWATLHVASAADVPRAEARQGAKVYGDAERGKGVVDMWCVTCHGMNTARDDRIPTLAALAANAGRTEGAVRAFLMQPHRPMPPLEISTQQIEDIVTYLATLRPTQTKPR